MALLNGWTHMHKPTHRYKHIYIPFHHGSHLAVRQREKARALSRPFKKHGVIPLATYLRMYKKGDIIDIKGMGMGKTRKVYSATQCAVASL